MPTLVVPGVSVEARFDILPPLPAPSGIVGAVGIVDRPPASGLVGVTKATEVATLLGPGTETTMPEVVHALGNGASEVVISAVAGGSSASVTLPNTAGSEAPADQAVTLRTRSNGSWGNQLAVEVRGIPDSAGTIVRAGIRLFAAGRLVEQFSDLQVAPGMPDDLFESLNRRSRYLVAIDPGFANLLPQPTSFTFADAQPVNVLGAPAAGTALPLFALLPADGVDPDGLNVAITTDAGRIDVRVAQGAVEEEFLDLVMDPDSDRYLPFVLLGQSRLVFVRLANSQAPDKALPAATARPLPFTNGTSPDVAAYRDAIERLADDPRIDLLVASIEPTRTDADVRQIHQALVAHAVDMANRAAPRIAFGSVTPDEQGNIDRVRDHAAALRNRRFVLVAPAGAAGAVAGMIGRMRPQDSPTFKSVPLFGVEPATYRDSELNRLLGSAINLCVVEDRVGRGVVVLRGIDTTGDQISVTRVADLCIRETKAIAENFIGELNSQDARSALRQQIIATFTRLEREGALVSSADGTDPAFLVDVYSTQQDFAQGIVRIDIAVRPVRAIDYVYATIRVKN